MRIVFCHNLKTDDSLEQAEFDSPQTVARISAALESGGHRVFPLDVSGRLSSVAARLEVLAPDLVFNTAEGRRGPMREAFFPSLFEHLGLAYTGAGGWSCALTLDKLATKRCMAGAGVPVLPSALAVPASLRGEARAALCEEVRRLQPPLILKPNCEGSGKGISEESIFEGPEAALEALDRLLSTFPEGIIIEPYVRGRDATVGYLEALDPPVLEPTGYRFHPDHRNRFDLYGYHLKNHAPGWAVEVVAPLDLPPETAAELMRWTGLGARALGLRDFGRLDYRLGEDGRAWFLEANALPSLEDGAGLLRAAELRGLSYRDVVLKVVESAARRSGIRDGGAPGRPRRLGLVFNLKRTDTHGDDAEAEYDSPKTVAALRGALESLGNEVVELEADADLPVRLPAAGVDLVFNIAEGARGRCREAQVPALCEMLGLPYTGSDPATLAICLDKALAKRLLLQAGIPTPRFALLTAPGDPLPAQLRFPLILKPNAEGTSKGMGPESVVDDSPALRALAGRLIERYRQPVIVEEYVEGREFTVGVLSHPRLRVLPPMEVVFNHGPRRPVYGYAFKQDFCEEVSYRCPAELTPDERSRIEGVAAGAFEALGCRDFARIDLRLDRAGSPQVIEVNPLPGLAPSYSDLCLITDASGMSYADLVAEVLAGAIHRARSANETAAR